jgi:transposase
MVIFHKKMFGLSRQTVRQFISRLSDGRSTSTKGGSMPYTEKQVAALQNAAKQYGTLNGALAGQLADELGQSKRSVIAKIKSLGLDYAVAKKPVKGTRATSKADYVAAIAKALDADASALDGLEKATALSLSGLLAAIQ